VIPLSDLLGTVGKAWEQMLADQPSAEGMKLAVERFLLQRIDHQKKRRVSERLIYINEQIRLQSHKSHLINRICREEGISINTLERQMKEVVGISPKQFHRIIRFNAVLQYIRQHPGKCHWAQVAYEFGYYDQTHFIKEFKRFYGKSPTSYSTNDWLLSSIAHQ
jgi:AraC-like DNA-binding protein